MNCWSESGRSCFQRLTWGRVAILFLYNRGVVVSNRGTKGDKPLVKNAKLRQIWTRPDGHLANAGIIKSAVALHFNSELRNIQK